MSIYHIHSLTRDGLDRRESYHKKNFSNERYINYHLLNCEHLNRQLKRGLKNKRWKVVTLVRDPIARNISGFFHELVLTGNYGYQINIESMGVNEVVEKLLPLLLEKFSEHEMPLTWFDSELKAVSGIDVFSTDFPKSKGYKIYQGECVDVLLLRLENLNECVCEAFTEFFGVKGFALINSNLRSERSYHSTYKALLNRIILPNSYIEKMYMSKYARHFYSEEEINTFRKKWSGDNSLEVDVSMR